MWEPLLDRLGKLAESRGKTVAVGVILIALALALAIPGLRVSSSYRDLMPADRPDQRAYDAFLEEFGAANDLIVVLEGEPAAIRRAADAFALRLSERGDPIEDVFYRVDLDELARRAPLYLDKEMLEQLLQSLSEQKPLMDVLATADSFPALLQRISAMFEGGENGAAWNPATAEKAVVGMNWWLDQWMSRIENPEEDGFVLPEIEGQDLSELAETLESGGYLGSRDHRMVFLFLRPHKTSDDPVYLESVEKAVREEWEALRITDETITEPVKIAFTGLPAHILTDVRSLRVDILRSSAPSAVMVFLILWIGLRSVRRTLMALLALGCGLAISLGLARFVFVELNRMSMSFLAIMFGIGIDFAIYLIRRSEEERSLGYDRVDAVKRALSTCGQGIIAGGLVTALAFTVTAISEFRGTAQLGLTTGLSVLVVLVTTLLLLPPVLMRFSSLKVSERSGSPRDPHSQRSAINRLAPGTGRLILGGVLVLLLCGAILGPRVPVDYSGLTVMPRNAESTEYQKRMQEESDFQMTSAVILAESPDEMKTLVAKTRELPSVERVMSLGDLLPSDQETKRELLRNYSGSFPSALPQWNPEEEVDAAVFADALTSWQEGLFEAQDLAFSGGQAQLTEALQGTIDRVEGLQEAFTRKPEAAALGTKAWQLAMVAAMEQGEQYLSAWKSIEPVTEDSLPKGFVNRFRSPDGNYAAFVYPAGSVWQMEPLETFLSEIRGVTPNVTGFPVISLDNVTLLTGGIFQSLLLTIGVVVVLLWFDFRKLKLVAFALFPLLVGMALLQVLLYVTGQEYNLASINGLPLLLGLGVVYGVHLVHRWAEAPEAGAFEAVRTSGRAIALAGVTTMAGLASLTFCIHQGVATFGWLLLQGIVCMLVAALFALPVLIDCFAGGRRGDDS